MGTFRFAANIILAIVALCAILFDRNKFDKLLGALILIFCGQGICEFFLGYGNPVTLAFLFLCAPSGLAFIIIGAKRIGEIIKNGKL